MQLLSSKRCDVYSSHIRVSLSHNQSHSCAVEHKALGVNEASGRGVCHFQFLPFLDGGDYGYFQGKKKSI